MSEERSTAGRRDPVEQDHERERALDNELPRAPSGAADDRFDGTDSGPGGWDTPYPPIDAPAPIDNPGSLDLPGPEPHDTPPEGGAAGGTPGTGPETTSATPTSGESYESDGPDVPVERPQR